jgi:hypothetical protein
MEFIWIEPCMFIMGSPANQLYKGSNEAQHVVTIFKGFNLSVSELNQG